MLIREVFALIAFASSIVFGIAGVAGLFRFPDPYVRLQAGALCGTTSVFSVFIGALLLSPNTAVAARVIIIGIFFIISAPTGAHIIARFAWNAGRIPWRPEKDRSKESRP